MKLSLVRQAAATLLALAVICLPAARAQTNSPGHDLVFNGSSQDVSVPHQASLNTYPLTVMCWFKTSSSEESALVNKYVAASLDGYELFVTDGDLTAWYFAGSLSDSVYVLQSGPVNDGNWHHAAFTVDASGGRLYLDGALVASAAWIGTPAPCTTTQPLSFGNYPGSGYYTGEIDEISLWNTAMTAGQIQTYQQRSLTGYEPNLLGYWRLDEGSGSVTADQSGNGHTGTLEGAPSWNVSTAPVGIVAPTGFSNGWTEILVPGGYFEYVASSADGLKLQGLASSGGGCSSTDGGATWLPNSLPTGYWDNIASSVDGTVLYASQSTSSTTSIYTSADSGNTWNPITTLVAGEWCVACSADGSTIVAGTQEGAIAVSHDTGATWTTQTISGRVWHHVTCSTDGTHMSAVAPYSSIYYSTDSGNTWHPSTMTPNGSSYFWDAVAASADGSKLIVGGVVGSNNPLYRSTDYGVTWHLLPSSPATNNWYGFASSADGSKLLAVSLSSVYVSLDSGTTWTSQLPNDNTLDAAISADGTRSVVARGQGFYVSLAPPAISITATTATNSLIAWPSPSAGFNLVQTSSLPGGGWTNTPIRPTVVSSQNQVVITNGSNSFFQLAFP